MSLSPPSPELERSRRALRSALLARRNAVPGPVAREAAEAATRHLVASGTYRSADRIAAYAGLEGELDPAPLVKAALGAGKALYLPRVLDARHMEFVRWETGQPLRENRFGISEPFPDPERTIAPDELDLVLLPLLGFDAQGNRLGFGAGFYDRAFAFRQRTHTRPVLCGYAYAWQETPMLEAAEWDVALDAVTTEQGVRYFTTRPGEA